MKVGMISLLGGAAAGQTFLLKNLSVFEGGRSAGNHVLIKDPSVAMSHFRICRNENEYVLYDQGAKNGTSINGDAFEKHVLQSGDVIRAGEIEMRFDLVDEDTPGRLASSAPDIVGASLVRERPASRDLTRKAKWVSERPALMMRMMSPCRVVSVPRLSKPGPMRFPSLKSL